VATVGSVIGGRFRVDQFLGFGGMGLVVAATHLELGHRVAIKFLRNEMAANPTVVERFLREARAAVQLRTEHVCRVSDVGHTDSGAPYMVMELLEGNDLGKVVAKQPLPMTVAAEYLLQACVGIAEAHATGIVHRDLKPANLFVTRRPGGGPLIKVLDFGIAKALSEASSQLTHSSSMLGSPAYISPEQLHSARDVDARADIWSLGATLYQLLSARLPFARPNVTEMAVRILTEAPDPLDIDPALRAVVMRCLEKQPAQRYADVAALAADLAPFGGPSGRAYATLVTSVLRGAGGTMAAPAGLPFAHTAAAGGAGAGGAASGAPRGTTPGHAGGATGGRAGAAIAGHAGAAMAGQASASMPGRASAAMAGQAGGAMAGHAGASMPGQAGAAMSGRAGAAMASQAGAGLAGHAAAPAARSDSVPGVFPVGGSQAFPYRRLRRRRNLAWWLGAPAAVIASAFIALILARRDAAPSPPAAAGPPVVATATPSPPPGTTPSPPPGTTPPGTTPPGATPSIPPGATPASPPATPAGAKTVKVETVKEAPLVLPPPEREPSDARSRPRPARPKSASGSTGPVQAAASGSASTSPPAPAPGNAGQDGHKGTVVGSVKDSAREAKDTCLEATANTPWNTAMCWCSKKDRARAAAAFAKLSGFKRMTVRKYCSIRGVDL
jgi:serine/threonine-protein kinase